MREYNFKGLAGCVTQRRTRREGLLVSLYHSEQAGLDADKWATVCEDHGGIVGHPTRTIADDFLSHPEEWCPTCQAGIRLDGRLIDLEGFLWDNRDGLDEDEQKRVRGIRPGERITIGGGAAATFAVTRDWEGR